MKREEILPFMTTWTELEGTMLSEIERQIMHDLAYTWHLKTGGGESS